MIKNLPIYDTEHVVIDAAISEAYDLLNAGIRAGYEREEVHEKYMWFRERLEDERISRKVDTSDVDSNGTDGAMHDFDEWAKKDIDAVRNLASVQDEVRSLIRKACRTKTGKIDFRLATALECRYAHFPPRPYYEIAECWPRYFRNELSVKWAERKGEAMVCQYVLDQRRTAASCVE